LIGETLDSVLAQTYENWECIIVDDGSTDGTEVLIKEYLKIDKRFHLVTKPNNYKNGGNGARNYGATLAKGSFLIFLDSDDLIKKSFLEKRHQSILENSLFDLCVYKTGTFKKVVGDSNLIWNDFKENETLTMSISRFLNQDMPWCTMGVLWNKEFFKNIGGWDENLKSWQDWEIHLRTLFVNPVIYRFPDEPDNYYRLPNISEVKSNKNSERTFINAYNAIRKVDLLIHNHSILVDQKTFKFLILRNLIHNPILNGFRLLPSNILRKRKFKNLTKTTFLKYYLFELVFTTYRLRRMRSLFSYYKYIKAKSTYLKTTVK
tara:strand:- start:11050 stop:12006 length:957 start_codon:yes stop_codon:yes gene_type:complete